MLSTEDATKITNICYSIFVTWLNAGNGDGSCRAPRAGDLAIQWKQSMCLLLFRVKIASRVSSVECIYIGGQLAAVLQHVCDVWVGIGYITTMAIHAATDHELCKCKRDSCGVHFIIIMKWLSSIHIHMCVRTLLSQFRFFFCVQFYAPAPLATDWIDLP